MEKELLNQLEEFDYDYFDKVYNQAISMKCEEIIKLHKNLTNKQYKDGNRIGNYGRNLMFKLLNYDYGYSIPKEFPQELIKFFNSTHTSEYFKNLIKDNVKNPQEIVLNAINSDRNITEFTEDELLAIEEDLNASGFCNAMLSLTFKLNSEGAIKFLNNKIDPITLIKRILLTSGLNSRAEYYSGRGARIGDLSGQTLMSIYKKLEKLDQNKALNMAKLTLNMPTLGATEFIEALYSLAYNNFDLEKTYISTNNMSLGNARDRERETIAIPTIISTISGYRVDDTNYIKGTFVHFLPNEIVEEIYKEIQLNDHNKCGYKTYLRRKYK